MEISKLSSVCKIFGRYAFPSTSYVESEVPLIRISNVKSNNEVVIDKSVSIKFEERFSNYVIQKQDILIALSGATTGKFGIYDSDEISYLNQRVGLLRANENINQRYLFYYLNLIQDEILRKAGGAAQPNISTTQLGEFQIPLPPLETQKAIAEKLDKADALRKKDQELLKQYDELAQSIFIEMFGDPVQNEKGWEIKKLGNVGIFKNGLNFKREESGIKAKILGVGDFGNKWLISSIEEYSDIILKELPQNDFLLNKDDIVFVRSNGNKNLVGRSVLIMSDLPNVTFSGFCIKFKLTEFIYNPIFLISLLRNPIFREYMNSNGRGANIQNINQEILNSLKIILPNLELQNQFAEKIKNIEAQKELVKKQAEASENLFQALLQENFNFS